MKKSLVKNILVTGGAGFIGSHLIDRLLADSQQVICLDNLNDYYDPQIKVLNQSSHLDYPNYEFIKGDIRDAETVNSLFDDYESRLLFKSPFDRKFFFAKKC